MHDPAERFFSVPAGPVRARLVELLVRVLTVAVNVVAPVWRSTRSQVGFVADQVRCRTRAYRDDEALIAAARLELDPVDRHAATAVQDRSLPPPLAHLEVLGGEDLDGVLARVIALGRADALALPAPGSWARECRVEDAVYVDDRRMDAALRLLDAERVELVRRSS